MIPMTLSSPPVSNWPSPMLDATGSSPSNISFLSLSFSSTATSSPLTESPLMRGIPSISPSPPLSSSFPSSPTLSHLTPLPPHAKSFSLSSTFPFSSPPLTLKPPFTLTADECYSLSEDEDTCSLSSTVSHTTLPSIQSPLSTSSTLPSLPPSPLHVSSPLRHRRLALSSPPSEDDDPHSLLFRHFSLSLHLPSPSTRHFLLSSLLSTHPFFSLLPHTLRRLLFTDFTPSTLPRHSILSLKSAPCDQFTVVEQGQVITDDGVVGGRGYTVGDLCLYHPMVGVGTVRVKSERVVVWGVEGGVVRSRMMKEAKVRYEELTEWLSGWKGEGGEGMGEEERGVLIEKSEVVRYEEGDWIVPSSLSRDHVFIIKEGKVKQKREADERVIGKGGVFAGDGVLFPTTPATLPRQPSPIPIAAQRKKRGREDSPCPLPSSLSTIYEDSSSPPPSPTRPLRRHRTEECVLPSAPSLSHRLSSSVGPPPFVSELLVKGKGLKRSVSSPACFEDAGVWGREGERGAFVMCASVGCVVIAVPVSVLQMDGMDEVKRTLISRMCRTA